MVNTYACLICPFVDHRIGQQWDFRLRVKILIFHVVLIFISWTKRGQVMHLCFVNLTIISLDNGLSTDQCEAIIWTNIEILPIGSLGTNFCEILIKIHTFPFKKIHLLILETENSCFAWGSIPCLLMHWLLKSPDHQSSWYWLCRIQSKFAVPWFKICSTEHN